MSTDEFTPLQEAREAAHEVASRWRTISRPARACYRFANNATHHVLGWTLKLVVLVYFLLGLVFLGLRYAVLPNIDMYKPDVEALASRAIGQKVSIDTIYASWQGLRPNLFLGGVQIHDRQGRPALKLPGVSATFSWWSVLLADVRLYALEISRPELDIQRDAQGRITVGGIELDTQKKGDTSGADWVLSQREIVIRDGRLRWNDALRQAPELELDGITFVLRNDWQHHRFALKATPPAAYAAPLDLRADFTHPHFTRRISDFTRWKGELYADLRNADLAVWKPYIDYPFAVQQGSGGVRAWLKFDHARLADFTADLRLANVVARLRPDLDPLLLTEVSGRISVAETIDSVFDVRADERADGRPTFGANGHAIALTDLSLRMQDGLALPATTISETYTPAKNGKPERTEVKAKSLDLATLADFIERMPLPAAQQDLLAAFQPRGQLKDFSATWQGAWPNIVSYNVNGEFAGLSLKAQPAHVARPKSATQPAQAAMPAIPGFENLSGRVEANDKGGKFTLDAQNARLHMGGYFTDQSMPFERIDMQASWTFEGADRVLLDVSHMALAHDGLAANFSGKYRMPLADSAGPGDIDLNGTIEHGDVTLVGRYLPLVTPEHTRAWLTGALLGGRLRDVSVRLKGDLTHFPFTGNDRAKGEFRVAGKIDDGQMIYTPGEYARDGKSPLWPVLEKIDGTISFERARMDIVAKTAVTHGVTLTNVKASLPDLMSHEPQLAIEGAASGPLQEFLRYLVDSPVNEMIGHVTEEGRGSGQARLALKLMLPLAHIVETKVQGSLQLANNDLNLFNDLPVMQNLTGRIDFNERGLTIPAMRGQFLGGVLNVAGGTQRDDSIVIRAEGGMTAGGIRRAYSAPAMQRFADRLSGSTRFVTTVSVRKKRLEVIVDSNLQGMGIDMPAPLKKPIGESLPLRVELSTPPGEEGARDDLRVALGTGASAINARYVRQHGSDRSAPWRVLRGGIGIAAPVPLPDAGLAVNVNLPALSLDAWSDALNTILGSDKPAASTPAADATAVTQYFDPDYFAGRSAEMIVANKKFENVSFGATHARGTWMVNLDAAQASGYLTWAEAGPGQLAGRATARLATLVIPKSAASEVNDFLEGRNGATQIPGLDIVAENFELSGKKLGRLELLANNVQAGGAREWRITKLSLANPDAELKATGRWSSKDGQGTSVLNYELEIQNAGKLLERFGMPGAVRNGKGNMTGELSWQGLPYAFDIPTMAGQFKLDLKNGQILKVETGAARLLSVLSLQSLPRRLTLDFRDIFSDGFAFDAITADSAIVRGVASTDNFKMRGPGGTVLLDGSVDLAHESQNLHAAVILDVNAGAASVVYALAVNPVIGVGTMLAQLFLREPLSRAFTFEYQVSGPWSEPVVTKYERPAPPAPAAPAGKNTTTPTPQKAG